MGQTTSLEQLLTKAKADIKRDGKNGLKGCEDLLKRARLMTTCERVQKLYIPAHVREVMWECYKCACSLYAEEFNHNPSEEKHLRSLVEKLKQSINVLAAYEKHTLLCNMVKESNAPKANLSSTGAKYTQRAHRLQNIADGAANLGDLLAYHSTLQQLCIRSFSLNKLKHDTLRLLKH